MKGCVAGLVAGLLSGSFAFAQPSEPLRMGVLTDMSSGFSAWSGKGSVLAAEMAVEDYERSNGPLPFRVEILSADHQNKADIATNLTREWLARGVNAILDVPNSAAALGVNFAVRGSKTAFLTSGGSHDSLTRKECSPNTVQWTFDGWSLSNSTATTAIERGGDTWYFITADFAGGHGLEKVASDAVSAAGGRVLGRVLTPLGTNDFSSALLQAQTSKAKVIGLAMGGNDFVNAVKGAGEFGVAAGGQKLSALAVFITDVHGLGLKAAQGLTYTTAFYWDGDEGKRAFSKRFAARAGGANPSQVQAGVYASALHYLKAVAASGTRSGPEVVAKMKDLPTDDPLFGKGRVRADGRHMHDMFVVEVKSPAESRYPWDYLKIVKTIPAEKAFQAASAELCSLVKPN